MTWLPGDRPPAEVKLTPYIVIRAAPGVELPAGYDGLWLERTDYINLKGQHATKTWVAYCTGRYEQRGSDGALAEIYEVPAPNWREAYDAPAEPAPPGS